MVAIIPSISNELRATPKTWQHLREFKTSGQSGTLVHITCIILRRYNLGFKFKLSIDRKWIK